METILEVYERLTFKTTTNELNNYLLPIIEGFQPPATKGKFVKIKYVTQLRTRRVAFVLFCNLPQYVPESYARFLENKLREHYPLSGVPVSVFFRKKN
jgi:GTPase